jgi:phytoene dehydrogenase-like protein
MTDVTSSRPAACDTLIAGVRFSAPAAVLPALRVKTGAYVVSKTPLAEKRVLIIGAGIAGLSAGCFAQMNGFQSEIFELHSQPGGLCTAWQRKDYTIDGCIHYLFGTAPGQPFHQVWQELGALINRPVIHHEELMRVVDSGGQTFIAYADPDRLEDHLRELSPADEDHIEDLTDGIRRLADFDMAMLQEKPRQLLTAEEWRDFGLKVMPFALPLARWGRVSAAGFAQRLRSPFLRRALPLVFGWDDIPLMAGMSVLAYMHTGNAGFPAGGSLAFARAIEQRYLALGGRIHYNSQVEKILTEDGRASGLRLYNDDIHEGDYIISAADGRGTLFDLLDGQFIDKKLRRIYDGRWPIRSQLQVSLGVDRDLSAEPHWQTTLLDEPLLIAGEERHDIGVKHYAFDPSLAPAGKSVVEVMMPSDYGYWQRIYGRKLYDTEQLQVAGIILDFLERRYPGITDQVEVKDVATPVSYERFTGNWLGSTCGWLLTTSTMMAMVQGMDKQLPGLDNLYLAGQWVEPGGSVPIAAMSGRCAVQLICAQEGQPFETSLAPALEPAVV